LSNNEKEHKNKGLNIIFKQKIKFKLKLCQNISNKLKTGETNGMSEPSYKAFSRCVKEYDSWYENNILFKNELAALGVLGYPSRSSIEIGVGTGRFAQRLCIPFGLEPAKDAAIVAKTRGVNVIVGKAEQMPITDQSFEWVYFIFSLCFVQNQKKAIEEAVRILKKGGRLVIGFVPKDSPWGKLYAKKGKKGHPLYRYAKFFTPKQLDSWVESLGLKRHETISSLIFLPEEEPYPKQPPVEQLIEKAGFIVKSYINI